MFGWWSCQWEGESSSSAGPREGQTLKRKNSRKGRATFVARQAACRSYRLSGTRRLGPKNPRQTTENNAHPGARDRSARRRGPITGIHRETFAKLARKRLGEKERRGAFKTETDTENRPATLSIVTCSKVSFRSVRGREKGVGFGVRPCGGAFALGFIFRKADGNLRSARRKRDRPLAIGLWRGREIVSGFRRPHPRSAPLTGLHIAHSSRFGWRRVFVLTGQRRAVFIYVWTGDFNCIRCIATRSKHFVADHPSA